MTVKKAIQKIEVAPKEASWLLCNRGGRRRIQYEIRPDICKGHQKASER